MDYRKFLAKEEVRVLPWLGGRYVFAKDRRLRVQSGRELLVREGWYEFSLKGRDVTVRAGAEAPPLDDLPLVRGHMLGQRLVVEGARALQLWLMPEEEPPRFSPARARRWHSGELLFDGLEFEGEAEEQVRRAFEESRGLEGIKGAASSLRAACAYAVVERVSRRLMIPAAHAEVRGRIAEIAEGGEPVAEQVLRQLADERAREMREQAQRDRARNVALEHQQLDAERERRREALRVGAVDAYGRAQRQRQRATTPEGRIEEALLSVNARLLGMRALGGERIEVRFAFMDESFLCIVDESSLQILDSGICLTGLEHDRLLTLESFPSVIKEAIETDRLVIYRHG